ncbi:MAG TPA: arylsulfotransferase family protein, partial [Dongiaceae bacterium]|nr:arylsulfotransferase family protein [Dongiaceae bacterium]
MLWTDRGGTNPGSEEHDLAGHVVQTVHAVGAGYSSDMHEVQFLGNFPDGPHYLLIGRYRRCCYNLTAHRGPASATIWDAVVQEVTPGGALVWSWDAADHVDPLQEADPQWWSTIIAGRSPYDVFHMNSAAIVDSASLLVSLRFADAIYKIRYKTAVGDRAIAWKLGGSPRAESLKLTDPHLGVGFGGQHYARTFSDPSDPAGAYVTLHDNGTGRGRAPRAVRYRIDESAKTATWTEQVTDAAVRAASCCGSARKLPQGDWVMSWGANPLVTELTPSGSRVFGITFSGAYSYRVDAILPGVLTRAALRSAMDSQTGAVAASAAAAADAAAADVAGAGDGDPEAPSADADDSSLPTDVQRGTPDPLETRVAYGPNPTSGALTFGYALARGGMVRIGIYDVAGRLRAELVRAFQPPGRYEVRWDARSL